MGIQKKEIVKLEGKLSSPKNNKKNKIGGKYERDDKYATRVEVAERQHGS